MTHPRYVRTRAAYPDENRAYAGERLPGRSVRAVVRQARPETPMPCHPMPSEGSFPGDGEKAHFYPAATDEDGPPVRTGAGVPGPEPAMQRPVRHDLGKHGVEIETRAAAQVGRVEGGDALQRAAFSRLVSSECVVAPLSASRHGSQPAASCGGVIANPREKFIHEILLLMRI